MPDIEGNRIVVSHINIRPSISILVMQLILLKLLVAAIIIGLYLIGISYSFAADLLYDLYLGLSLIVLVFSAGIFMTIFAVLSWMNEYYELGPKNLIHKKGLIFRREEKYPVENIKFVQLSQGFLGKMFNFGTLTLLDLRRNKLTDMYLIHNPLRYYEIMDRLFPGINEEGNLIREKFIEPVRD